MTIQAISRPNTWLLFLILALFPNAGASTPLLQMEARECSVFRSGASVVLAAEILHQQQDSLDKDYKQELPRIPPSEPAEALAQFETNTDLTIQLIASEPMVMDPVAIAFDAMGRAFVVEMRGYSEQGAKSLGRIKVLEDENGDGRYDRATIFAENFQWPTAICCAFGGVLVGDAPDIIFLKDDNGDHVADVREVIYTGFGISNVQQLLNNFHWGVDNRIYGATGGNGGTVRRAGVISTPNQNFESPNETHDAVELRGRDFVIDPRTLRMSTASGGGQFGLTFDRWGNRFVCSNSDHCQQIVIDERYIERNPLLRVPAPRRSIAADGPAAEVFRMSDVEPWRRVRTRLRVQGLVTGPIEGGGRAAGYFTSATGITVYDGDALPPEYSDNVFVGDVGSNLVHRKTIEDSTILKTAIRAEARREFLCSPDNWFRPVQMSVGPNGALIILDMYRETVEHPASLPDIIKKHLDLNSGNDRGRLYQIVPKQFDPQPRMLPGESTPLQLVDMLEHSNGWHRRTAARLLFERQIDNVVDQIRLKCLKSSLAETRIRAMYLLAGFDQLPVHDLRDLLNDSHPYVRLHALRTAEQLADVSLQTRICQMVDDEDIRVRYQLALTLGQFAVPNVAQAIAALAVRDGDNHWMRAALASSAYRFRPQILRGLITRLSSNPEFDHKIRPLARELAWQIGRNATDKDLQDVANLLVDSNASDHGMLGELLVELTDGTTDQYARLERAVESSGQWSLQTLVNRAVQMAAATAVDPDVTTINRVAAINVLRLSPVSEFREGFSALLDLRQPPEVKQAALDTASRFVDPTLAEPILTNLRSMNSNLRRRALQVLMMRPLWIGQLLERMESGLLDPTLIDASIRQQLTNHPNPTTRRRAVAILQAKINRDRSEIIDEYATALHRLDGDTARGREVFRKSCVACHRLENDGNEIGPSLSAIANQGAAAALTHILDPNREVDPQYLSYLCLLEDGRTLLGMISNESAASIALQDTDGKTITISRDDIDEMHSTTKSLMPENYENEIDHQAMADLIAYLMSQGQ